MWLSLLSRFGPYLVALAALSGAAWWLHHQGYESGYAASEAKWQPRFDAAERAKAVADEMARRKEAYSTALSQKVEAEHEKAVASLNLRAADADKRLRALSLRLATASARRCEVPPIPGAALQPDAAAEVIRRAEDAGGRISSVGAACESDAATLAALQRWVTEQRAIINGN